MESLDRPSGFWWAHLKAPVLYLWISSLDTCASFMMKHLWSTLNPAGMSYIPEGLPFVATRTELPTQPYTIDLNVSKQIHWINQFVFKGLSVGCLRSIIIIINSFVKSVSYATNWSFELKMNWVEWQNKLSTSGLTKMP